MYITAAAAHALDAFSVAADSAHAGQSNVGVCGDTFLA